MKIISISILVFVVFYVISKYILSRRMKRIPAKSTEELEALFVNPPLNFTVLHEATLELQKRGENISFTFPVFLDLALAGGIVEMIGAGCLRNHFGDRLSHIDLTGPKLTSEARSQLQEIKEQVEKITNESMRRVTHDANATA